MEGEVLKPRKRRKDARIRDKKFVNALFANGGNATKAAFEVGEYTSRNAAAVSGSLLKKRNEDEIEKRMSKFGLDDELVFKRHKQIIEEGQDPVAMKGIDTYYKVTKKEGDQAGAIHIQFHF